MLLRIYNISNAQHFKIIFQNDKKDTSKYPDKVKYMYNVYMYKQYSMCKSLKKQKQLPTKYFHTTLDLG